ncbi:MAG: FMN-binding protein, partial [Thermoguttaceae bacterium]
NPMPGAGGSSGSGHGGGHHGGPPIGTGTVSGSGSATTSSGTIRSRSQVESLIDQLGRTPPEWWDSVPLDYPPSLDLNWSQPPPGSPWNSQKNMGQYIWDIINPNPTKWKSGVRLMHHLLSVHKSRPEKQAQVMNALGRMYQNLLGDHARAAFWWRKAGADRDTNSPRGINLAVCYWKLGNKQMAIDLLGRLPVYFSAVKLFADMGETQTALRYAEAGARGESADLAYLYAGDACRVAGRYRDAIAYYEKCLHLPPVGRVAKRIERNQQRARANIEGIRLFDTLDLRRVADGTYRSSSPGYVGPVHVEVVARSGRIESVRVTGHKEKQFFSSLTETPRKIVEKQGVKGVDATTNATITSEAIINATAKALAGGMRGP